ncbi:hypothetical protein CYY_003332 [Polysphondylium violaceum]|uniref:Arylamine N-acetyltransferase n=1 Tax=Polysphondylium violaceum TaxID=133409 RepID=A0A8J4Q6Y3_9MYCE|nr:hypothetical protein CYY_003332 [Polysphondylium violaceum]
MDFLTLFYNHVNLPIDFKVNNLEDLEVVMKALCVSTPFNNLDILDGSFVELNRESTIQKVLIEKSGGQCYHISVMMYLYMIEIGLDATMFKVLSSDKNPTPMSENHISCLLKYTDGNTYLVDVSIGVFCPLKPILIDSETIITGVNGNLCRSRSNGDGTYLFECKPNVEQAPWFCMYHYNLEPVGFPEVRKCQLNMVNDNVVFLLNSLPVIFRFTQDENKAINGTVTLSGNSLTENRGAKEKKPITDSAQFKEYLVSILKCNYNFEIKPQYARDGIAEAAFA